MKPKLYIKIFIFVFAICAISFFAFGFNKQFKIIGEVSETRKEEIRKEAERQNSKKVTCHPDDLELKCKVKTLIPYVGIPYIIFPNGSDIALDPLPLEHQTEENIYYWKKEKELLELGETAIPTLIEIFKEDRKYDDEIIYILGEIGSDEANAFLKSIVNSESEECFTRSKAAHTLRLPRIDCSE